ncbi:MAG TPA: hypothetical protein VLK79_12790 [Gaiellales bacterium]|nr:hypothetical protein [Gaiellales bacterium]
MKRKLGIGETIQLATRIPKALHREAMILAVTEDRPLQEIMTEALTEHLERCRGTKRARLAAGMPREGV